jgi:hypothetical protein
MKDADEWKIFPDEWIGRHLERGRKSENRLELPSEYLAYKVEVQKIKSSCDRACGNDLVAHRCRPLN